VLFLKYSPVLELELSVLAVLDEELTSTLELWLDERLVTELEELCVVDESVTHGVPVVKVRVKVAVAKEVVVCTVLVR
jgi:hypothetical protein